MYAAIYLCAGNEKIFYDTQQIIFDVHKTAGAIQIQFEFLLEILTKIILKQDWEAETWNNGNTDAK